MNRRRAHQTRHTATGRDEAEVTPCSGEWSTYDVLIDGNAEEVRYARRAALQMCATCPIQPACFERNRHEGWVRTMVQGHRRKVRAVTERSAA